MFQCQYTIFREFTVVLTKVKNHKMTKYNAVICCYDEILVNVAAYVIPG